MRKSMHGIRLGMIVILSLITNLSHSYPNDDHWFCGPRFSFESIFGSQPYDGSSSDLSRSVIDGTSPGPYLTPDPYCVGVGASPGAYGSADPYGGSAYNQVVTFLSDRPSHNNVARYSQAHNDLNFFNDRFSRLRQMPQHPGPFISITPPGQDHGMRYDYQPITQEEVVRAIAVHNCCAHNYHMSSREYYKLLRQGASKFKNNLLNNPDLSNMAAAEILGSYLDNCNMKKKKFKKLKEEVLEELERREEKLQQELQLQQEQERVAQEQKAEQERQNTLVQEQRRQQKLQEEAELRQEQERIATEQRVEEERQIAFVEQQRQDQLARQKYLHGQIRDQHSMLLECPFISELPENQCLGLEDAFLQAERDNYAQYQQCYELNSQAKGYMLSEGIDYTDYEEFTGTAVQQYYHNQTCEQLCQVAAQKDTELGSNTLLDYASSFVGATLEANKSNFLPVTAGCSYLAQSLLSLAQDVYDRPWEYVDVVNRYGYAVGAGVGDSVVDFAHLVSHPVEAVRGLYGISKAAVYVLETAAIMTACQVIPYNDPELLQIQEDRIAEIKHGFAVFKQKFDETDGPDRVRAITKLGADFVIPGKILAASTNLLMGAAKSAKNIRTLEGAACLMTEELGMLEVVEEVAQNALQLEKTSHAAEISQCNKMDIQRGLSQVGNIVTRYEQCINELKSLNGVIPFENQQLRKRVNAFLTEVQNSLKDKDLSTIRKMYEMKKEDGKEVRVAIDHICSFELGLKKCSRSNTMILNFGGGHLPGVCEALEKTGLVNIVSKETMPNGVVKYVMENAFTKEIINKTELPVGWTAEKAAQAVWETYETGRKFFSEKDVLCKEKYIDEVLFTIPINSKDVDINGVMTPRDTVKTLLPYKVKEKK